MRVIESAQKVDYSDDEDQPNSLKGITHTNIKIPEGNHIFERKEDIEEFRKSLPIIMKEQ